MDENSKQINNNISYYNYKKLIPKNIFSYQDYDNVSLIKSREIHQKIPSKNHLIMNCSEGEIYDSKEFKGRKISQSEFSQNILQKTHRKHLHSQYLTTCRLFLKKINKLNESSSKSNNALNLKKNKLNIFNKNMNKSCDDLEKKTNFDITPEGGDKTFKNIQSNIFKIEYLKKIIRKHYFDNFDDLKDFFNDICMSTNCKFITIDDIVFYLKKIIKIDIDMNDIKNILNINGIIKLDFNNFKFIFFPDIRNNKMINLKIKNEKCNFIDIYNTKYYQSKNIKIKNIKKLEEIPKINTKEYLKKNFINKSLEKDRIIERTKFIQNLKFRGLKNRMKFLLIDINKDFILKRFKEKYNLNKINKNNFQGNNKDKNKNKNKLNLFILKLNKKELNKAEDTEKIIITNPNNKTIDENCHKICYKLNKIMHLNKSNELSNNKYKSSYINEYIHEKNNRKNLSQISLNNNFNIKRTKINLSYKKLKDINEIYENKNNKIKNIHNNINNNNLINQDSNKGLLFFKSEFENLSSKDLSQNNNNMTKKNSDILDYL